MLRADYEFLFVGKDENSFLENFSFDLYQEFGEKSGEIFVNLEIQNNPVDAQEIARAIFETMQKVFFEDVAADPYGRFEVALKAINNVLTQFKTQRSSGYVGNLNVIIAAIVGEDLFLTQCGDAEAYLIRKRYVSVITEGLNDGADESEDIFSSIASGKIEAGDTVIFSTTRLIRYIAKTDLAQLVHKTGIGETLNDVRDSISTEILGRVGLTGILFMQATKEDEEIVMEEEGRATEGFLESKSSESVVRSKESFSGKFFSFVKSYAKKRPKVYQPQNRVMEKLSGMFSGKLGKNKILYALIALVVILAVSVVYLNNYSGKQEEIDRLDRVLQGVHDKIAEAETKGVYDKETAKEILDKAYVDAKSVFDSEYYRDKASLYLIQIEETRDKLDNVTRIEQPKVLADLTAKRSDANALGFANFGDRVFIYEYNALYEIVLDQVQDPLTIDDEETVVAATGFAERNSIIFLTKSGKLMEYKDGNVAFMDTEEGAFHKGTAITDWSNRIYMLDPASNQVWKYTYKGVRETFGAAEPYISDKTDVSSAKDVAIDSSVYVLQSNGDLLKFYGGTKAEFFINNPPSNSLSDPAIVYTNEKLDNVYVVDSKGARVLVFKKDSQTGNIAYTAQYSFEGVTEIRDVYVNPDSKKMYVLTPTKVIEQDI